MIFGSFVALLDLPKYFDVFYLEQCLPKPHCVEVLYVLVWLQPFPEFVLESKLHAHVCFNTFNATTNCLVAIGYSIIFLETN